LGFVVSFKILKSRKYSIYREIPLKFTDLDGAGSCIRGRFQANSGRMTILAAEMNPMNIFQKSYYLLIICSLGGCAASKKGIVKNDQATVSSSMPAEDKISAKTDDFIENLMKSQPEYFDEILQKRDSFNVQIIYTQINRQADNTPIFKNHYFNYEPTHYRYPASTVKMPVALLALQRLHELKIAGLDRKTAMITEAAYSGQTPVYNDPSTADGSPSIEQYIKKIFLVSDNDAFNRLYEFLGQEYINEHLHAMGYKSADILHHLDLVMSEDENRHTNPVNFFGIDGKPVYEQAIQFNQAAYPNRKDAVGNGYYRNGQLINEPLDFSKKNRLLLYDLNEILKSILFPAAVSEKQRFNIAPEDYKLVWQYMSQFPPETISPVYDSSEFQDAFAKLLLYGTEKGSKPKHVRIFNKEGDAYGFLTDVAYIVDFEKNIEFMLSASIYCNRDGILNDNKYDYDTLGYPFMKHLGEIIYNYELKRERQYAPDLSVFRMQYDK